MVWYHLYFMTVKMIRNHILEIKKSKSDKILWLNKESGVVNFFIIISKTKIGVIKLIYNWVKSEAIHTIYLHDIICIQYSIFMYCILKKVLISVWLQIRLSWFWNIKKRVWSYHCSEMVLKILALTLTIRVKSVLYCTSESGLC